eukprot:131900-Hanusia_phi.AAC.1
MSLEVKAIEEPPGGDQRVRAKAFPSDLDSKPLHLTEAPSPSEVKGQVIDCLTTVQCPTFFQDAQYNEERIVYNAVGGEERAGFGLAGMAVEEPRKWPYAIPEAPRGSIPTGL